jgi:hypothetical protein
MAAAHVQAVQVRDVRTLVQRGGDLRAGERDVRIAFLPQDGRDGGKRPRDEVAHLRKLARLADRLRRTEHVERDGRRFRERRDLEVHREGRSALHAVSLSTRRAASTAARARHRVEALATSVSKDLRWRRSLSCAHRCAREGRGR